MRLEKEGPVIPMNIPNTNSHLNSTNNNNNSRVAVSPGTPFATSTPRAVGLSSGASPGHVIPMGMSPGPFGMVRLNATAGPLDNHQHQFLMHQAARINAAAAALAAGNGPVKHPVNSPVPGESPVTPTGPYGLHTPHNNTSSSGLSSSSSSTDKSSSGSETPMSRTNQYKKVRTFINLLSVGNTDFSSKK